MTDQTEPKLQVNDWAWHIDGYLVQIAEVQDDGYGVYLGGHTLYSEFVYFNQIQKAVAIHPIEHHKCKDCEYWDEKVNIPKSTCPTRLWLLQTFHGDIELFIEPVEMAPPPNCYCFTPKRDKLSPDEKESK